MKKRPLLLLIPGLIIGALAGVMVNRHPSVDAAAIVAAALNDEDSLSYKATATTTIGYCGKPITSEIKIFHAGDTERIEYLSCGKKHMWSISQANRTATFVPRKNVLLISEANRLSTKQRTQLLLDNYDASYLGMSKIAGRDAYGVELAPKRSERPKKRLWIDKESKAVLKTLDFAADGTERGEMTITSFRLEKPNRSELAESANATTVRKNVCTPSDPTTLSKKLGFTVRRPGYISQGFVLEGYNLSASPCCCNHLLAQISYTDGLNCITVFERSASEKCKSKCCSKNNGPSGSCSINGCEMAKTGKIVRNGKIVAVVADLPKAEIEKIAESVD